MQIFLFLFVQLSVLLNNHKTDALLIRVLMSICQQFHMSRVVDFFLNSHLCGSYNPVVRNFCLQCVA